VRGCRPVRGAGSHGAPLLALLPLRAVVFANEPSPSCGRRRSDRDCQTRLSPPVVSIRLHCLEPTAGAAVAMPSTCFERPKRCGGAALRLVKGPRLPAQSSRLSAQLPYCSWPQWHLRCGQTRRLSAPGRPRTCLTTKRVRRKHQVPQRELIDRSLLVPVPLGRIQAQRDGSARQSCRGCSAIVPAQRGRAARWLKPA
jgi:hypothetical protein